MKIDINIRKIENFYYVEHEKSWKRDTFSTRKFDGIVFFTEGSIEYIFEDKTVLAQKGDLLFLPGNLPYTGKPHTEKVAFFVLNFESENENDFENFIAPSVITPQDYDIEFLMFSNALNDWNRQPVNIFLKTKMFVYSVLCQTLERTQIIKSTPATNEIIEYIVQNLNDENLNVLLLCEKFYISQSQLRRNIHQATNLNPNEYILTLRLNKAKNELIYTEKPIKQIAGECGFSSPYYFSNCFNKKFHTSPVKFREIYRIMK